MIIAYITRKTNIYNKENFDTSNTKGNNHASQLTVPTTKLTIWLEKITEKCCYDIKQDS